MVWTVLLHTTETRGSRSGTEKRRPHAPDSRRRHSGAPTTRSRLLESVYAAALAIELGRRAVQFTREVKIPVSYDGEALDTHFRLDFLVDGRVVVEVKAVEQLARVHEAQLLTYLRLGGFPVGLLLNFNVVLMKQGIVRRIL